jgi:pSer/pThr/pTyr-binding forkhead associated (FHA) protein
MLRALAGRVKARQETDVRAAKAAPAPAPPPKPEAPSPPAAPPARTGPVRTLLIEPASATEFDLTGRDEANVGRIDRASGFRPEVDLTELDTKRTLSRRHAKIVKRGDDFYVCEVQGAHNGTFVNGERLATGAAVKLTDGARVRFGLVELVVRQR